MRPTVRTVASGQPVTACISAPQALTAAQDVQDLRAQRLGFMGPNPHTRPESLATTKETTPVGFSIWPVAAVALVAVLAGCTTSPGRLIGPSPGAIPGAVQTGEASWYGKPHHGHRTASGEIFDMYRLTAAHPSLPFGSRVRVTNLRNGRSVEVRVNDRGPIVAGRIIDLSYAAAQELVAVSDGTIPVRIRVLSIPR